MAGPRQLNWVRNALRVCRYSIRTEQCCIQWIKRTSCFMASVIEREEATEPTVFLSHLTLGKNVAAPRQNQALAAILFCTSQY